MPFSRSRRSAAVPAALTALTLLLSGCSLLPGQKASSPSAPASGDLVPSDATGALKAIYTQKLTWDQCLDAAECAQLTVPIDYAKPDGQTIKITVLRVKAKDQKNRLGSLVVNPGGPGGSGVQYAAYADYIVGKGVRERYDIVGFDPRGVGESAPIECVTDTQMDDWLGADPTPDDPAEIKEFTARSEAFAQACKDHAGPLLARVGTVDAVKDMDVLRAALGDSRLTFLGKSYGTLLGATYADLFPTRVGRFVLDGVVAPDLTNDEMLLGQAEGFERASRAWAQFCIDKGSCPMGDSVDAVMAGLRDLLSQLDQNPMANTGDPSVPALTEGWALNGIAQAMYSPDKWTELVDALTRLKQGDAAGLMKLGNDYARRNRGGGYSETIMESINPINCVDAPQSADPAAREKAAEEAAAKAPTYGRALLWSSLVCGLWKVPPTREPHKVSAEGAPAIVVIGTTRDPATPYEWAVRLRDQLSKASLITFDGDGHTAYGSSNNCVDDAVDAFLLDGAVPKDGLRC